MNFHRSLAACLLFTATALAQSPSASTKTAATPVAHAILSPTKPIPPFSVWQLRPNAATESQVGPTTLNPQGHWLLAYVDPTLPASQTLLAQLQSLATDAPATSAALTAAQSTIAPPPPLDAAKLVIVLSHATGAETTNLALKYPGLAQAAWTHDVKREAAQLLNIKGSPHLFGMIEGQQRWTYAGSISTPSLRPVVLTWLAYNQLPPNKLTITKQTKPQISTPAQTAPKSPTP